MSKTIALMIGAALLVSATTMVAAQTTTTPAPATTPAPSTAAPAPAPAAPTTVSEKAQKAMAANEKQLAACMAKAGTDEAKKTACQKKHDMRQMRIQALENKAMEKSKK